MAVVLLLYIVGKRLRKRGVMEQTGPLKLQSWLRHLGMILIVTIVCIFVISALTLFTSLPTFIMMAANWESQIGMLNGDPSGMPEYVRWMTIIVFLLAGFIQAYVMLSFLFPIYYMYGSIDAHESERKEFNNPKA